MVLTALAPATWGTTYIVTTELLPTGRPLLAALVRALPAGVLLVALGGQLPRGQWWARSLVLGTLNIGVFFSLIFVAAYRLPGGVAGTLGALQPFAVALWSWGLLSERPTSRTLMVAGTGVAGVALMVLNAGAQVDAVGLAAMAGTLACMPLGIVLAKRWGSPDGVDNRTVTGWMLVWGGIVIAPFLLLMEGLPTSMSVTNLSGYLYLSVVGTAIAYTLWFRGISRLRPVSVSLSGLVNPVVATAAGWIVLGQAVTGWQAVGAVIALAAVAFGTLAGPRRAGPDPDRDQISDTGPPRMHVLGRDRP